MFTISAITSHDIICTRKKADNKSLAMCPMQVAVQDTLAMAKLDNLCPEVAPKPNDNPSLPHGDHEMHEWVLNEREYRRNLQGKVLRKAALDAQDHTVELRNHLQNAFPNSAQTDDSPLQTTRPVIWGSNMYRELWEKASTIAGNTEIAFPSATSPTVPELQSNTFQEESLQSVPLMEYTCMLLL